MKEQNHEKEFEQSLKKKSEGFELKPSGKVWRNIESSLRRDRRKVAFWWSVAALMALVIGTGGYYILQNENSDVPVVQQSTPLKENKNSSLQESTIAESNSSVNPSSEEKPVAAKKDMQVETNAQQPTPSGQKEISRREKIDEASIALNENPASMNNEQETPDNIQRLSSEMAFISALHNEEQLSLKPATKNSIVTSSSTGIEASHQFSIEADVMPLVTYCWNKESASIQTLSKTIAANNSFWDTKGFSFGGNFLFHPSKTWFIGSGIHFTKTITQINFATEEIPQYDTTYVPVYSAIDTIINISYIDVQPKETDEQHWLDVSFFAGAELFPYSKNHLRLALGAAYSHLISLHSDNEFAPPGSFDATGGNVFITVQPPYPLDFKKDQLQLFSEVAYVHDFGSRLSASAGGQFHYYPFNLVESSSITQHMLTLGLKVGVQYNF